MLPLAVNVYKLKPPLTAYVGEPVVDTAGAKLSAYLNITTPEPPFAAVTLPPPAPPPVFVVPDTPATFPADPAPPPP